METCEEIRTPISELPLSSQNINGKYGFAERILDGIYVSINSVVIHFKAKAFHASIQLSRIVVQSKTPTWENAFDLRLTRIKEELRGEVLIFKEAEWQTLRIEANALEGSTFVTTPLRLIANQSKARITIKKNLQDCTITASRLLVNLDDLLWVLTDSQLKAALSFVNSLKDIIQKSAQQSKLLAADKMKKQEFVILPNPTTAGLQQQSKIGSKSQQAITKVFEKYNVAETSYHLHSGRIDLHLCDESTFDKEVSLKKVEGGAIQMTFMKMWFDYYPYHPSGTERSQWLKYDENMASRDAWAQDLLKCFHDDHIKIQKVLVNQEASSSFNVKPLTDITKSTNLKITDSESVSSVKANDDKIKIPVSCEEIKISQLLENSLVFRLNDFVVYQVSSSIDSRNKKSAEKFLSSDKKTLWLPPEMSSLHIEYTDYYFSESKNPVPCCNTYVVINPLKLIIDYLTVSWLNVLSLSISHSLDIPVKKDPSNRTDIFVDALMPRILFPAEENKVDQMSRPNVLQLQISRVAVTNCGHKNHTDLKLLLEDYSQAKLFQSVEFPKVKNSLDSLPQCIKSFSDKEAIHQLTEDILLKKIIDSTHSFEKDILSVNDSKLNDHMKLSQAAQSIEVHLPPKKMVSEREGTEFDSLKPSGMKDVWCFNIDQLWMEFIGASHVHERPIPFLESVPLTLWVFQPRDSTQTGENDHFYQHYNGDKESKYNLTSMQKNATMITGCTIIPKVEQTAKNVIGWKNNAADIHILAKIGGKISLQINHCQFIFLSRLVECITNLKTEIQVDTETILKKPLPRECLGFTVIVNEAELVIFGEPKKKLLGQNESSSDTSSNITEKVLHAVDQDYKIQFKERIDQDSLPGVDVQSQISSSPNNVTELTVTLKDGTSSAITGYEVEGVQNYVPDVEKAPLLETSQNVLLNNDCPTVCVFEPNMQNAFECQKEKKSDVIKKSVNSGFSSLSKGISNWKTNLTDIMKHNMTNKEQFENGDTEDWEAISIQSSEDEDYLLLKFENRENHPAFEKHFREVCDDGTEDDSELVNNTFDDNTISAVTFSIFNTEIFLQLKDEDITLAANIHSISSKNLETTNAKKLQDKIGFQFEPNKDDSDCPIKLQFCLGPQAERVSPTSGEHGFLHITVDALPKLQLPVICIAALTDLVEDEKNSTVIPLLVEVTDTCLTFKDSRPPSDSNSVERAPIDLHINNLLIKRSQDGVFHFTSSGMPSSRAYLKQQSVQTSPSIENPPTAHLVNLQGCENKPHQRQNNGNKEVNADYSLQQENKQLRRQLERIGKLSSETGGINLNSLEILQRECDCLKIKAQHAGKLQIENRSLMEQLARQADDICVMKEERESLLASIQMLQEELQESENLRMKYKDNLS